MPRIRIAKKQGLVLLDVALDPTRSYTIGRSQQASIRLEASSISRLHAVLFFHDDEWMIADLGSTTGMQGTAGRTDMLRLADGDWVSLGPAFIWFEDDRPAREDRLEYEGAFHDRMSPEDKILLIEGPELMSPKAVSLGHRSACTIGSDDTCDVVIRNANLDPLHAVIFPCSDGWRALSLGGNSLRNQDGMPTRSAPLEPENTVFAGSLGLSMLTVWRPAIRPGTTGSTVLGKIGEQPILPQVDLEACARRGRADPPNQTSAA